MFSFDYAVLLPQILLEGISLGKYKGPIASIAKDSATFRARLESNFSGDVYGLTAGVSGRPRKVSAKDYTLYRRAAAALRKASGSATAFGDILGVLGYLPAYNRNRMRGMSQEEAIDKFNEYNETQQSRRPGERAPIQIYQNGLSRRALTAFTSSQILYLNNSLRHANNISKAIRKGEKIKAEDSRGLIFNAIVSSVLFSRWHRTPSCSCTEVTRTRKGHTYDTLALAHQEPHVCYSCIWSSDRRVLQPVRGQQIPNRSGAQTRSERWCGM